VQSLLDDPRFRPAMRILLDHRRLTWTGVTTTELRHRIDLIARDADRLGYQRVAWVGSGKNADSGVGRMLQTLSDQHSQMVSRVFDDIDEARAWLRELD